MKRCYFECEESLLLARIPWTGRSISHGESKIRDGKVILRGIEANNKERALAVRHFMRPARSLIARSVC